MGGKVPPELLIGLWRIGAIFWAFRRTRLCNVGDWCALCGVCSHGGAGSGVWCVSGSFVTG